MATREVIVSLGWGLSFLEKFSNSHNCLERALQKHDHCLQY